MIYDGSSATYRLKTIFSQSFHYLLWYFGGCESLVKLARTKAVYFLTVSYTHTFPPIWDIKDKGFLLGSNLIFFHSLWEIGNQFENGFASMFCWKSRHNLEDTRSSGINGWNSRPAFRVIEKKREEILNVQHYTAENEKTIFALWLADNMHLSKE